MNSLKAKRSLSLDVCETLVGRKTELEKITDFVLGHVKLEKSGCLYISGLPGTGKTLSVARVLETVKTDVEVNTVYINCMQLHSANDLYKTVYTKLKESTKISNGKNYLTLMENFITTSKNMNILCLDEIDQLTTATQDILYTVFCWPGLSNSRLILIGIANACDLTERILPKLRMRITSEPFLINFHPYSKEEIADILKFRLYSFTDVIESSAISLCAGKVSAIDGDVRKALAICKLAIDKVEQREITEENRRVKPMDVAEIVNQVYGSRLSTCSKELPFQQKLVLAAALKFVATKSKSFTVDQLFTTYKLACAAVKVTSLNSCEVHHICQTLESCGLIRKCKKKQQTINTFQLGVDETTARSTLNDETLLSLILH